MEQYVQYLKFCLPMIYTHLGSSSHTHTHPSALGTASIIPAIKDTDTRICLPKGKTTTPCSSTWGMFLQERSKNLSTKMWTLPKLKTLISNVQPTIKLEWQAPPHHLPWTTPAFSLAEQLKPIRSLGSLTHCSFIQLYLGIYAGREVNNT